MTGQPGDGTCRKCSQWRPLFQFNATDGSPDANVVFSTWLCAPHFSEATVIHEADGDVWSWLPKLGHDYDPWTPPPRTALERAIAYGPIGRIVTTDRTQAAG